MKDKVVRPELYPSNSFKSKDTQEKDKKLPEKEVQKVVTNDVIKKKKTIGEKFKNTFVVDDAEKVGDYIIKDVVIPTIKDTIVDIVTKGINMIFYGDARSVKTTNRNYVGTRTNYGSYSSSLDNRTRNIDRKTRASHDFDNLIFSSRGEAEEVRDHLAELTYMYGQATVADLYDLAGITSEYTDHNYGWEELGTSKVRRVRDGYIVVLPRAKLLEEE